MSFQAHIILGITFFGLAIFSLALNALAQNTQPVVAPWSVDNTDAQSRIRQYQNFKQLQTPPLQELSENDISYEYSLSAPQKHANRSAQQPYNPLSQQLPSQTQTTPSALENMYSGRIVDELNQFGYDLFGIPNSNLRSVLENSAKSAPSIPSGAVQDDFILASGDELEIFFTGQRTDRGTYTVNSQGLLIIPDFPPIPATGRTIGQVRISIEAAAGNLHNTKPYVSLASVRQIGVLVVGHAKKPGRQTLTVFHTVLDALMEAGGIEKTGSLRQIKLVRGGRSTQIDLYALLLYGSTHIDMQLRDGDRIIVPSIGPTLAVSGEVKRPGIYEILPTVRGMHHQPENRSEHLTLNEMLELGGGVLAPGKNRFIKLGITPDGQEIVEDIADAFKPTFGDGSILMISKGGEKRAGTIELLGHTRRPGLHALNENPSLSKLLPNEDILGNDIYPLIGIIERWDTDQLTSRLLDFPLRLVLKGEYDRKLQDGDIVHLFSNAQIRSLNNPQNNTNRIVEQGSLAQEEEPDADTLHNDETLTAYLRERSAFIRGAVRAEGLYPVAEGITLDSVLAVAGGLALEADRSNIEVTSTHNSPSETRTHINLHETNPEDIIIGAGDSVRANQKFNKIKDNSVLIMGEVHNPGRYDLAAGDKISDLLARAGGLTDQAYPYGAIFSRASERRAEEMRFQNQAREVELAIGAALEADDTKTNAGKIAEARALATELRSAQGVGRITVEADPAQLSLSPELDLLLESGDRLYIPRRNLTVRVSGEVLSPASLQFRERKASLDYIHEAGGFTFHADKDRTFVIYPDGAAQPLQVSSWNYNPVMIPPGSTIVVPRDPKPFDFIQSAKDVSQILSNLAVTAIFIDDVADSN
ncbi:MAG: SLBB domain-containing protein [Alphaproteobacteria bacterium]|nr:SLBB domain-containing protein [Alphaproteobacteria bacterium]